MLYVLVQGDVPQDDLIEISAHLSNKRTKSKSVSIESNTVSVFKCNL